MPEALGGWRTKDEFKETSELLIHIYLGKMSISGWEQVYCPKIILVSRSHLGTWYWWHQRISYTLKASNNQVFAVFCKAYLDAITECAISEWHYVPTQDLKILNESFVGRLYKYRCWVSLDKGWARWEGGWVKSEFLKDFFFFQRTQFETMH